MRAPTPVGGFPAVDATWRHIGGLDFQVVRPYVLVSTPDPMRPHLMVWLRRRHNDDGHSGSAVWSAHIVDGTTVVSEHRGRSAGQAAARVMTDQTWATAPIPDVMGQGTDVPLYPDNYAMSPAGWYADRAAAHDGRWDSRTGVL